ncbi:MAG: hypothetical protein WA618_01995 [Terriglobales bacterium]
MPTEPYESRHNGERIAALEKEYEHLLDRINHLDDCVDNVKSQVLQHGEELRKNMLTWDRRWWAGLGFVAALIFLSGSGFVSLKSIVDIFSKVVR